MLDSAMNRDDATYEDALRQITPSRLEIGMEGRLLMALDDASAPVVAVNRTFESAVADWKPSRLPDGLMDRAAALVGPAVVAMPVPERVIPFRRYAAAAAIGLVGAAAALLAPIGGESPSVADTAPTTSESSGAPAPVGDSGVMDSSAFIPAGHQRGLSDARNEGIVWRDNAPHRVLRIVYKDTITLQNEAGETVEVEQPRVEYILVPEKVD